MHIDAERVVAVDTVGAGDAFCGSLAYFLTQHMTAGSPGEKGIAGGTATGQQSQGAESGQPAKSDLCAKGVSDVCAKGVPAPSARAFAEIVRRACKVATQCVLKHGSLSSFPFRNELPPELFTSTDSL